MYVLGTCGHVDHGKSSFLKHLTGQEPDRLPEEKKRGMTIDLNFVWMEVNKNKVGIVDVPGHKRFLKNMITGVLHIDAFLFIVAADDGWMPQSEEHFQVLKNLGVQQGLVIITKTDLVAQDRIDQVKTEIASKFPETPVFLFSAEKPETLPEIKKGVASLIARLPTPVDNKQGRLWIDRVFVPKGQGVVITGTLREGSFAVGDTVLIYPEKIPAQIKSLSAYHSSVTQLKPVTRAAVQLSKVSASDVRRGQLLQKDGNVILSKKIDTKVNWLKQRKEKTEVAFHMGTFREIAKVAFLEKDDENWVRLSFETPIPVRMGDHFLLRTVGEERTLGFGEIRDPGPKLHRYKDAKAKLEKGEIASAVITKAIIKDVVPVVQVSPEEQKRRSAILALVAALPLTLKEIEAKIPQPKKTLSEMAKAGDIVALPDEQFVSKAQYQKYQNVVETHLRAKGQASSSDLKTLLNLTRKTAIPILEQMDRDRLTYLKEGVRRLLKS